MEMKYQRLSIKELSYKRILNAILRRITDFPNQIAWNFSKRSKHNQSKIEGYKNFHQGERCFIIGNGPSLAITDLSQIKKEYSFGLNRIYLNFNQMDFLPSYYVATTESILDQFSEEIKNISIPKFINWNRRSLFIETSKKLLFLKLKYELMTKFRKDICQPISGGGTVTFVALQIAYFMGFREVILIGIDHSFSVFGTPNTTAIKEADIDVDHFHPNYFPKGSRWQLPDLTHSEYSYGLAREAYEADNRKIRDATIGGKCQVFEKIDFADLF